MLIIVIVSKSIMFSNLIVAFSRSHIEVPADLSDERGLAVRPLDLFVIAVLVTANRQILLFVESLLESAILSQFVVKFLLADMKALFLTNLGIWQPPIL